MLFSVSKRRPRRALDPCFETDAIGVIRATSTRTPATSSFPWFHSTPLFHSNSFDFPRFSASRKNIFGLLTLFPQRNPLWLGAADQVGTADRRNCQGLLDQTVEE